MSGDAISGLLKVAAGTGPDATATVAAEFISLGGARPGSFYTRRRLPARNAEAYRKIRRLTGSLSIDPRWGKCGGKHPFTLDAFPGYIRAAPWEFISIPTAAQSLQKFTHSLAVQTQPLGGS